MNKAEYDAYLQTDHWATMRRRALDVADHRCQLCYSPERMEVHHRTYERIGAERLGDLTALCDACHQAFHRFVQAKQAMQDVDLGARSSRRSFGERARAIIVSNDPRLADLPGRKAE